MRKRRRASNGSVRESPRNYSVVMAGLVPAIHDLALVSETWMPATSAGMTEFVSGSDAQLRRQISTGRLFEFLTALGQDVTVTVTVKPTKKRVGEMEVVMGTR